MNIVLLGAILHIIFLLSVFDIYFKSPIIDNIPVQYSNVKPPAKRLVLFVADGLRADSLFKGSDNEYLSPYLRSVVQSRGAWGVAHSRVPTESRPGHIALIAGFYEDPSAVFTGWKDNIVEFDSIFNRSHVTFSWGSPDILPMFKKGAVEDKVHTFCYDAEDEDFSGHGSTRLNTWVFEEVHKFLNISKTNDTMRDLLNNNRVVFFLHLLGTDVAGHSNKPHSRQYKANINVIDDGVKQMEELFNEYYGYDNETVFVYTSDHGMTDWGSHGAGSESETQVPLVVWGAGAASPHPLPTPDPATPTRWGLNHLLRRDVAQADVCPLMAALVGLPIPVHSVGVLPLDYLDVPEEQKAAAILLNARQLVAQFARKREMVEGNLLPWLYTPFPHFTQELELLLGQKIPELMREGKYNEAIEGSKRLISVSQVGLEYYHLYFQNLLLFCVSLSFLGWIAWLFCRLLHQIPGTKAESFLDKNNKLKNIHLWPDITFMLIGIITIYIIYVQSLPPQFYVYCCLPLLLWWSVVRQLAEVRAHIMEYSPLRVVASAVLCVFLLELLLMTFFARWVLSVVVGGVALWPLTLGPRRMLIPTAVLRGWQGSLLVLAVFPALPVVGQQTQLEYVILCGGFWILIGLGSIYLTGFSMGWVSYLQTLMVAIATLVVYSTSCDLDSGLGLHPLKQALAWILLVSGISVPLLADNSILQRCLSIGLGLAVPFLLLSVGHEAFFLLVLFLNLCTWMGVEASLARVKITKMKFEENTSTKNYVLTSNDFRKSFLFLMYILLSFFGTGNIASINSFDVSWVRCFLTVFSPFTMMSLVLLKTVIPFLLVTCIFKGINIFSQVRAERLFIIVLIYCDIMGLHFLFLVTNKGSWLEIGTSVSHFVIMEVTVLFLVTLYYTAQWYTGTVTNQRPLDQAIAPLWQPVHKKHPD